MIRSDKIVKIGLLLLLITSACTMVPRTSKDANDMSYLYNPLKNSLHPKYRVYNDNENRSTLSIKFYSQDLFFSEANAEGVPMSSMVVFYRLFNLSQGRVAIDTSLIRLSIREMKGRRDYVYNFPLKADQGSKYEVELLLKDAITNKSIQAHIPFDKTITGNKHDFKVRGHFNQFDIFTEVFKEGNYVNILYPKDRPDSLYLSYFEPFDKIPIAPSMLVPEKELDLTPSKYKNIPYSDTLPLMVPNRGVYLFATTPGSLTGYPLFNFGTNFPGISEPEMMIEPLIYLSSETKINEMLAASSRKIALDNFWLGMSNNVEKSRELLRIYYNRVLFANYFFSSYKEGWRTDRGMIYIIYGPPDKVYKTSEGEKWGYLKPEIKSGWGARYRVKEDYLYFSFMNRENPFTYTDYTIIRSESVTSYWEQAIRSWQSGIVFRLDNPQDL